MQQVDNCYTSMFEGLHPTCNSSIKEYPIPNASRRMCCLLATNALRCTLVVASRTVYNMFLNAYVEITGYLGIHNI